MGKLTAIQTQSVFDGLWNLSKIDEHSVTFILDSGRIYTHGIYINGAVYGTEANGAINLTIAGSTKSLALSSHSHSNYYSKSENLDITSYIIKSGSVELLKYADNKILLGGPAYINGSVYSVRNNVTHTILDTGNFSIESKTSSGTALNNVTTFKYGNTSYQLDYVKRLTGTYTFDGVNYTSAALINNSSKLYGLLTLYLDGVVTNPGYAQLRISVPDKTLEIRTSASTSWVSLLKGGSYKNWSINGANKVIATTESTLPAIYAPTSMGTLGQVLCAGANNTFAWQNLSDLDTTSTNITTSILANVNLQTAWSEAECLTDKLSDGSYMLLIVYGSRMYTGVFSLASGDVDDEIVLHCAGTIDSLGGVERGRLYASIGVGTSDKIYLKLAATLAESNATVTIKYKKLI